METFCWAIEQVAGSPQDKLVLMWLGEFCDMDARWEVKFPTICPRCEMSEDEIVDSIIRLQDNGLLTISGDFISLSFVRPPIPEWMERKTEKKHKPVGRLLRKKIYARDNHSCVYCGSNEHLTIDHKLPVSRGGGNEEENLATACRSCNSRKATRTPEEWAAQK